MATLKEKARKDFETLGLGEREWVAFFHGYVAAVKRFGGK
jgi:hypothetical protein